MQKHFKRRRVDMIENVFRKVVLLSVLVICVMFVGQSALAGQNDNNNPTEPELLITEVRVDFISSEIVITGVNFDNGDTPVVTLGDDPTPLVLNSNTATEIKAVLPAVLDGDYLLAVSTGPAVKDYDEYDLTIGAMGPQGEQGPAGPQGPPGPGGSAVAEYEQVSNSITMPGNLGSGSAFSVTAQCPGGKKVLGGGIRLSGLVSALAELRVFESVPATLTTWRASAIWVGSSPTPANSVTLNAFAVCAN
jgi:hypothetical protein